MDSVESCNGQKDVTLIDHWRMNGTHYSKTLDAWLAKMDANPDVVRSIMEEAYGKEDADKQIFNWRLFFMFCSEVFGHSNGNEFIVAYHLFKQKPKSKL